MTIPDVSMALQDWEEELVWIPVDKTESDFQTAEKPIMPRRILGVVQPIPQRALLVKPEGQRSWNWFTVWTKENLRIDDKIENSCGRMYRVMKESDWQQGGYREFELTETVKDE